MKEQKNEQGAAMEEPEKKPKFRSQEQAGKAIRKALSKAGVEKHEDAELEKALTALYQTCGAQNTAPTRAGFAEVCRDKALGDFVRDMERDPFAATGKKKAAAIAASLAAVVVIAGCTVAAMQPAQTEDVQQKTPVAVTQGAEKPDAKESAVTVTVKAEGAEAAVAKARGEVLDKDGNVVIVERDLNANAESMMGKLPEGSYALHMTAAPVCADGSTYKLPEAPVTFQVGADGSAVQVEVVLEKLEAADMTQEQLLATAETLAGSGDEEAAQAVRKKAGKAPSVPGSEDAVKTPAPSKPNTGDTKSGNDASSPSNPADTGNTAKPDKPNTGNTTTPSKPSEPSAPSKPSKPSKPSDSESEKPKDESASKPSKPDTGGETKPEKPAHQHSWVAQTKIVHHDAEYKTVHHDAVKESVVICLDCGKVNPGRDHMVQHAVNGESGATTVREQITQEAYDEQVLVKDAWDEEVVTGYKCSCGATK